MGQYSKSGTYGSDVNLPLPTTKDDPNFKSCIDRNA